MAKQEDEWDPSQPVIFEQAGGILVTMGFLSERATEMHPDYKLFQEFWDLVQGEIRGGIKVEDLAYVLKIIRGYRNSEMELDCEAPEECQGLAKFIIFNEDGDFILRKGGQTKLANRFRSFYINKLQSEANSSYPRVGKPAEIAMEKELVTRPVLSQITLDYAKKRKQRLQTENYDIVDHLLQKDKLMSEKKQMMAM